MPLLRVASFTVSLDGFGAGPNQSLEKPLGVGAEALHEWFIPTRTYQRTLFGRDEGTAGVDNEFAEDGFRNLGAWILGRNMFGPVRGPWPDGEWKGWWGPNPPYHVPVFVLTHHKRAPIEMEGGTVFHFVTGGINEALERARDAAGELDIRVGGGVETIRQFLKERLIDKMHIAISRTILGSGEHLFTGIDLVKLGYKPMRFLPTEFAVHVVFEKQAD
jgi:dihydrofolate reductase